MACVRLTFVELLQGVIVLNSAENSHQPTRRREYKMQSAEASKLNLKIEATSGPDVEKIVKEMYAAPKEVIEQMSRAIKP